MKVEVDLWQLIAVGGPVVLSIIGAFWGMAKMIMAQARAQIVDQFDSIAKHLTKQDEQTRQLERELMQFRAELPRDYVRREDYVQAIASISTKIDSVWLRMENLFNKLAVRGRSNE